MEAMMGFSGFGKYLYTTFGNKLKACACVIKKQKKKLKFAENNYFSYMYFCQEILFYESVSPQVLSKVMSQVRVNV